MRSMSTQPAVRRRRPLRPSGPAPSFTTDEARWDAVQARDRAADGAFFYAVRTTGVYCRPSCAARLARRENVSFHPSCEAAEGAGFRPCKRCRPRERPAAEEKETMRFTVSRCALGLALVAATDRGLCAILLGDDPSALVRDLEARFPNAQTVAGDAELERRVARVVALVESPRRGLELPLDVRGTPFQKRVWQALREIPPGSTASYAEIAERVGRPRAVRAVAQACAANALAVAIPCHRVVRRDGGLSGYRWGTERKRALLQREEATG